jgi:hypothetical protein
LIATKGLLALLPHDQIEEDSLGLLGLVCMKRNMTVQKEEGKLCIIFQMIHLSELKFEF